LACSVSIKILKEVKTTNFTVLGYQNRLACNVEVIQAEEIKVSRHASQTFNFKDPERFIEAIKGKTNVVIYVGKVKDEAGNEEWRAMYWEPSDPTKDRYGTGEHGTNVLPLGSLAWLHMESEFDLKWELAKQHKEYGEFSRVHKEVEKYSRRIREINRDSPFADTESYGLMGTEELKKLAVEMKQAYSKMTNAKTVELAEPDKEEEEGEEDEEE